MQAASEMSGKRQNGAGVSVAVLIILSLLGCDVSQSPDGPAAGSPARIPASTDPPDAAANVVEPQIRASRVFAGRAQYPPEVFAAYGILAFQSEATDDSRNRYLAICQGFLASLSAASTLQAGGTPLNQQMATVWPLVRVELADQLNTDSTGASLSDRCGDIVADIDIFTSQNALEAARKSDPDAGLDGVGPYLLAWAPATTFGQNGVLVLRSDLSGVTTAGDAMDIFVDWRTDIQSDPELWRNGWDLQRLRTLLRDWAERYGAEFLRLLGLGAA